MGDKQYKLHLPKDIPVALFWSVTAYDALTASGLDNGQPFPSINTMDKPAMNADGSTDIYFGPDSPANALRTGFARSRAKAFLSFSGCTAPNNSFSIRSGCQAMWKS